MELYFGSLQNPGLISPAKNMVTFAIPDIGVSFKASFAAENLALEYASLLTLLEFVDVNPQIFANRALELYCNCFDLVRQVNSSFVNDSRLTPFLQRALEYRQRWNYSINWVPGPDNPAQNAKLD